MPQPAEHAAAVRQKIAELQSTCAAAGFSVSAPRPIDYGEQLTISDGAARVTLNVYGGKRGVRLLVGGAADTQLYRIVSAMAYGEVPPVASSAAAQPRPASPAAASHAAVADSAFPPGPWIGSDESGKGDYFGPLVAAAVYVAPEQEAVLRAAGVRDSKLLDDTTATRVAAAVRRLCADRFAEEVLPPVEYNALYARFKAEKQNLNHLLAWGHVHVLDALLTRPDLPATPPPTVIADRFADERYIRERLQLTLAKRGAPLPALIQTPRAEANVAVAAASILARDRFLAWLAEASARYGLDLPKGGANPAIVAAARSFIRDHGLAALGDVAKLHFATTAQVTRLTL